MSEHRVSKRSTPRLFSRAKHNGRKPERVIVNLDYGQKIAYLDNGLVGLFSSVNRFKDKHSKWRQWVECGSCHNRPSEKKNCPSCLGTGAWLCGFVGGVPM